MTGAPQVKIAVTTYSTSLATVLGDDTEGVCWFSEALHKAGAVTEMILWQSFGAVLDGANIWWVKTAQNDEVVRRLRKAALIKGFFLQEAPRGITNGFDIEIMVGRRCQQGPLSESVQRDIKAFATAEREKSEASRQRELERRARLANLPRRIITWDQETEMLKAITQFPIAPVAICMPMGDGDDYAIQRGRIFKQARINIGQSSIDLGERFPPGVRIYWTPDGNNNRDAATLARAIEVTGVRCLTAERQLSESLDILKQFQIHIYVGASVTPLSQAPGMGARTPEPA